MCPENITARYTNPPCQLQASSVAPGSQQVSPAQVQFSFFSFDQNLKNFHLFKRKINEEIIRENVYKRTEKLAIFDCCCFGDFLDNWIYRTSEIYKNLGQTGKIGVVRIALFYLYKDSDTLIR